MNLFFTCITNLKGNSHICIISKLSTNIYIDIIMGIVLRLSTCLKDKWQVVIFAEFHFNHFQPFSTKKEIESFDYKKILIVSKNNHFEYPNPVLFRKIRKKLRPSCNVKCGSSNLYSRFVGA